jgi:hypothetical protein
MIHDQLLHVGLQAQPKPVQRAVQSAALAKGAKAKDAKKYERVVPQPSYNIPGTLLTVSFLSVLQDNKILAGITGILGVFLAVQANRVKFVFDTDSLVRSCTGLPVHAQVLLKYVQVHINALLRFGVSSCTSHECALSACRRARLLAAMPGAAAVVSTAHLAPCHACMPMRHCAQPLHMRRRSC